MYLRLSYEDQINAIASVINDEIQKLESLSDAEAKIEAHNGLVKIGFIDDNGNLTAPYAALRDQYV